MLQVTVSPFTLVGPGQTAHGQAGFTSPANASYAASITNDPHSIFKVTEISATRATLEYNDDGGGGAGDGVKVRPHRPVPVWVDAPIGATNGATPLKAQTGDKLVVKVQMVCPNDPADTYLATLTITSSNSGDTTSVPLSVPTGQVDVQVLNNAATGAPGFDATWLLSVRSVAGAGGNISFSPDPGGAGSLSAPAASISIPPVTAFLPRRGHEIVALKASIGDVTPPGSYGFFVAEEIFNRADTLFSPFSLSLKVTNPQVIVASDQPSTFYMVAGGEVQFNLYVQLKGVGTALDLILGPTPQGLTCTFLDAQGNPIPKWHLDLTTKEQINLPVRVRVDQGGAPSPASLNFSWTAYDGGEQGSIGFGISILPSQTTQRQPVLTPSGTALGGWVEMTLRSNGTYTFKGQMHDSGWDPYDFRVRAVVSTPNLVVAAQRSGHTDGTGSAPLGHPNRDFDWQEDGSDPRIETFWPEVSQGKMSVSKSYEDVGVLKAVEDIVADFLGFVAADVLGSPALGLALVIGSELGKVTGLKWGDPAILVGVAKVAGIMAVFGFGALVPAIGVAVATAPNHRRLTQEEAAFASTVFGDTLPIDRIVLTDLIGLGGRRFTFPNVDGDILVNLGPAYGDPMHYTQGNYPIVQGTPGGYPTQGQLFIHELVHTWQIANRWFVPGWICDGAGAQMQGSSSYGYGPAGPPYSSMSSIEAQAAIVDQWFGTYAKGWSKPEDVPGMLNAPKATSDPYFMYIANNIRMKQA